MIGHTIIIVVTVGDVAGAIVVIVSGFLRILRKVVVAIGRSVAIPISVGHPAAAGARIGLGGVVRTVVDAIRCSVSVPIGFGHSVAAGARIGLGGIVRTAVDAIRCSVAV
jgi:hypothetical protein